MGVLGQKTTSSFHELWCSPRLTVWFLVAYGLWFLLGSWWSWERYTGPDSAGPAKVTFTLTPRDRVEVYGEVLIHGYPGLSVARTFIGDTRIHLDTKSPKILQMTLWFDNVEADDRATLRFSSGLPTKILGDLFQGQVTLLIPLTAGEQDIELSLSRQAVRYMFHELHLMEPQQDVQDIMTRYDSLPIFEKAGVIVLLGSGWMAPYPDPGTEDPHTDSRRRGYLLLNPSEPGEYEIQLSYHAIDPEYGPPVFLLDGAPVEARVTQQAGDIPRARLSVRLEKETHSLCLRLSGSITSPLGRWQSLDDRFLGYRVPWNRIEIIRKE